MISRITWELKGAMFCLRIACKEAMLELGRFRHTGKASLVMLEHGCLNIRLG